MCPREVVEGEKLLLGSPQGFHRPGIFLLKPVSKPLDTSLRLPPAGYMVNVPQHGLCLGLAPLGELVQDVQDLVTPAVLSQELRPRILAALAFLPTEY